MINLEYSKILSFKKSMGMKYVKITKKSDIYCKTSSKPHDLFSTEVLNTQYSIFPMFHHSKIYLIIKDL